MQGKYGRSKPYYRKIVPDLKVLSQSFSIDDEDFTDVENATGYADFDIALPAGAIPLGWKGTVVTAFTGTGTTTATMSVGITGDLDRFSADATKSVFTAGTVGSMALAADACDGIDDAVTVRVTVTEDSDFTSIDAGLLIVDFYYIET